MRINLDVGGITDVIIDNKRYSLDAVKRALEPSITVSIEPLPNNRTAAMVAALPPLPNNPEPCHAWTAAERETIEAYASEAVRRAAMGAVDLSDEEIVKVLASFGTDAEKSRWDDNPVLQVRTTVPGIRRVVKAFLRRATASGAATPTNDFERGYSHQ